MKKILLVLGVVLALPCLVFAAAEMGPRLDKVLAGQGLEMRDDDGRLAVWVYFVDKGLTQEEIPAALLAAEAALPDRTLERRAKVADGRALVDLRDLPVSRQYLTAVQDEGARHRRSSRWFNAASFTVTDEQLASIARLPFVRKLELVARFVRQDDELSPAEQARMLEELEAAGDRSTGDYSIAYGLSTATLEQINVPPVHEMGLTGKDVIVGQLDSGFVLTHESLQHIPILATYDFVHDDDTVTPQPGDHEWQLRHGTQVLSTMLGFSDGAQVGPAFGASAILAMTEDTGSETEIEEDNWVAGIEWVESLGADIVNTSLGYYYWYEYEDLDGDTCVTTVAADMAAERGLLVITSAGNQRGDSEWPYLTAPADGDSVVACAAVDLGGNIASFSSPGPTFDGRIKPDVAAQGVGVPMAAYYADTAFMTANGTSFAAPLITGVATLMLERVPSLTPMQIRDALRETASMAGSPNNDFGWGIIDAYAAVTYWGAAIQFEPLGDTEDVAGPYTWTAEMPSRVGLDLGNLHLVWRVDGGAWNSVPLVPGAGDSWSADIPGQPGGGLVEYYLEAGDLDGIVIQAPHGGPDNPSSFTVGADAELPYLFHVAMRDQALSVWPPLVEARASDNLGIAEVVLEFSLNGGTWQGPHAMTLSGDTYELVFPLEAAQLTSGDVLAYTITAYDSAAVPNATVSGPWSFNIRDILGSLLVIDDTVLGAGAVEGPSGQRDTETAGMDMAQWLVEMGYEVEVAGPAEVDPVLLESRDAVFYAAGTNPGPASLPLMRSYLVDYADRGGKIVLEGGSLAQACYDVNLYQDFAEHVLHVQAYLGMGVTPMRPAEGMEDHPVLVRPNFIDIPVIQDPSQQYNDHAGDGMTPMADAQALLHSVYYPGWIRSLIHDNNTAPEAGQVVFFAVAFPYLEEEVAKGLLDNALTYLLAPEAPGNAMISGSVTLVGSGDASGVTVSTNLGGSAVTGPDGSFAIPGLHGASYYVTAEKEGYGPVQRVIILEADEVMTDADFTLYPITEVNLTAHPELAIPDFNDTGVSSSITVTGEGTVNNITIDIDIEHPSVGHLEVNLYSPAGTRVTLHNNTGATADDIIGNWPATLIVDGPGSLEDFLGEPVQGEWTLTVADTQFGAIGTFHSWGLNLLVAPEVISSAPDGLPRATRLVGAVPNPFNPQTQVVFELAGPQDVALTIYDVRGHKVRRLQKGHLEAGRHEILWDGKDTGGRNVASGVYFCLMQASEQTQLIKMALVR